MGRAKSVGRVSGQRRQERVSGFAVWERRNWLSGSVSQAEWSLSARFCLESLSLFFLPVLPVLPVLLLLYL